MKEPVESIRSQVLGPMLRAKEPAGESITSKAKAALSLVGVQARRREPSLEQDEQGCVDAEGGGVLH